LVVELSGILSAVTATAPLTADVDSMFADVVEAPPEEWTEPYSRAGWDYRPGLPRISLLLGKPVSAAGNARVPEDTRSSPGIVVNKQGERFYDEASPTQLWRNCGR